MPADSFFGFINNGPEDMMHVVFIQHGNFAETAQRFERGESETYYAQRYSVDCVVNLLTRCDRVTVITVKTAPFNLRLSSGIDTIGLECRDETGRPDFSDLVNLLPTLDPTHLIVRSPMTAVIRWGIENNVQTLPLLADSFGRRWRHWLTYRRIASQLNRPEIRWVANHNLPACQDLVSIGVAPEKVIPWDWPLQISADLYPSKQLPEDADTRRLMYVGVHSEAKGLGDLISSVKLLTETGQRVSLTCVGDGPDTEAMRLLTGELGIQEMVSFMGRIEHAEVVRQMHDHDVVVVPSRHSYPEGLPMTVYDALSAQTPLVISDHPMLVSRIHDGQGAAVFRASSPRSLAETLGRLLNDAQLYRRLSESSRKTLSTIECPVKWSDLVEAWLFPDEERDRWLASNTMKNLADT